MNNTHRIFTRRMKITHLSGYTADIDESVEIVIEPIIHWHDELAWPRHMGVVEATSRMVAMFVHIERHSVIADYIISHGGHFQIDAWADGDENTWLYTWWNVSEWTTVMHDDLVMIRGTALPTAPGPDRIGMIRVLPTAIRTTVLSV